MPSDCDIVRREREPFPRFHHELTACSFDLQHGRGGGIRTPDPLVPNQMRYQTALRPDSQQFTAFISRHSETLMMHKVNVHSKRP